MCSGCESLYAVNITGSNTINVEIMKALFQNRFALENLIFGSFDTNNVIDMSYMFENVYPIVDISLETFNSTNVKQ